MRFGLIVLVLHVSYTLGVPTGHKLQGSHLDIQFTQGLSEVVTAIYNQLNTEEAVLVKENTKCEKKINASVDTCNTCVESKCQGANKPDMKKAILTAVILRPAKQVGARLKNVGLRLANIGKKFGSKAEDIFNKGTSGAKKIITIIVIKPIKTAIGVGKKVWSKVGDVGKKVLDEFKSWFGRKRRATELDAKTRRCFSGPCRATCGDFLNTDTAQDKICGAELSQKSEEFMENVNDMNTIVTAVNTTQQILNAVWVVAGGKVTGYEALIKGSYKVLYPEKPLAFPNAWDPPAAQTAFWVGMALDYYKKYSAEVTRTSP